jgi:lysophospholipase L1-like esterase
VAGLFKSIRFYSDNFNKYINILAFMEGNLNSINSQSCRKALLGLSLVIMTFAAYPQNTLKILPLGNSITYDYRDNDSRSTGDKIGYRYMLYTLLSENGFNFDFIGSYRSGYNYFNDCDNSGFAGIDTKNLADLIQTGTSTWTGKIVNGPYLDYYPPDVILLEIGTNDMYTGRYSVTEVNRLLNEVDNYEQRSGKSVLVIVATIISIKDYPCYTHPGVIQYNDNLETLVQNRIANGDKLVLADMHCGAGINYYNDMFELLHPNQTGYDKMGQLWYNTIASINSRPIVSDIPNQTVAEGNNFANIYLDNYVFDPDDPDSYIQWSTVPSNPQNFTITIDQNRVATITPKNADWNGSETITFVAFDNGKYNVTNLRRSDQDNVVFTVTAVNDPPVILSQKNALSVNEDNNIEILISNFNVSDIDNPLINLSLMVQAGTNYTFSGNRIYPAANFNGALNVNVVVYDGQAQSNVFQALVTVLPINDPPSLTLPANRSVNERVEYTGQLAINDIDVGDNLNIIPVTKPSWLNFNQTNLTLYGTPTSADVGTHAILIRGSDGKVTVDSAFTIVVINVNDPPIITSTPVTLADDYELYNYTFEATDPEHNSVSYSALMVPSWTQFDQLTGLLSGTPRYFDVGDSQVKLRVSDGLEYSDQDFTISVQNINDIPVIISNPDTIALVDEQFSYSMIAEDPDEDDILSYSALALPSWLEFYPGTDLLIGKPETTDIGKSTVILQASDGKASTEQRFTIVVSPFSFIDNKIAENKDLVLYPNPARDFVYITSVNGFILTIDMAEINGKTVFSKTAGPMTRNVLLDDLSLPYGFYIVKVTTTTGTSFGKVIIR